MYSIFWCLLIRKNKNQIKSKLENYSKYLKQIMTFFGFKIKLWRDKMIKSLKKWKTWYFGIKDFEKKGIVKIFPIEYYNTEILLMHRPWNKLYKCYCNQLQKQQPFRWQKGSLLSWLSKSEEERRDMKEDR